MRMPGTDDSYTGAEPYKAIEPVKDVVPERLLDDQWEPRSMSRRAAPIF